jgi:hypothetical protein
MQFIKMIISYYSLTDITRVGKMFFVKTEWSMIIIVYFVRDSLEFETEEMNYYFIGLNIGGVDQKTH